VRSFFYHGKTIQEGSRTTTTTTATSQECYWRNELDSLGILESKRKTELNDVEELENLADIIKQAIFQDYKVAYTVKKAILIKKKHIQLLLLAEVVGSNHSTQSIFINLVKYGVILSLILMSVGQKAPLLITYKLHNAANQ